MVNSELYLVSIRSIAERRILRFKHIYKTFGLVIERLQKHSEGVRIYRKY